MESKTEPRELMEPRYLMDEVVDVHIEYEVAYLKVYPHSGKRSRMVSSMGGNVWDGKGCDDNVISTTMDAGSVDTG